MAWKVTVATVDKTAYVMAESVSIQRVFNERDTASLTFLPGCQPAMHDAIVIYQADGVTAIFAGVVIGRRTMGRLGEMLTEVQCGDWCTFTDWCSTSLSYAVGPTLKAVLQDLITNPLTVYSITLDGAQAVGATLEPFAWSTTKVSDALRELSTKTGWIWNITPAKVLSVIDPAGAPAAPYALTDAAPHCLECNWEETDEKYATKVLLICGPDGAQFMVQSDSGASPLVDYWASAPEVTDVATGQEIADGLLASVYQRIKILTIVTDEAGFAPGQTLTVDLTTRGVDLTALITSVEARLISGVDWRYTISALEGAQYQGSGLDTFRAMLGSGGGSVVIGGGGGGGTTTLRASPFYLGGSRNTSLSPGTTDYTSVVNWTPYEAQSTFTGLVRVSLWARAHTGASVGVTARLWNATDNAAAGTSSKVTDTSAVEVTFSATIEIAHRYILQISLDHADGSGFAIGQLESP